VFSIGGRVSNLDLDVEDSASSLLEYRDREGRLLPIRLHQDYVQKPARRRCVIVGDAGKIEWNLTDASLDWHDADGALRERCSYADFPRNQLFVDELRHFLECVKTGASPDVTVEDGAASLSIALSLLDSQRTGMPAVPAIVQAA
jgi:predicted dehydrogenase